MNVLAAILDGAERGSTRYRWLQYQSEFADEGVTIDNVIISSNGKSIGNVSSVLEILWKAPNYDVLFVQKLLPPSPITHLFGMRSNRMIYDIDDALYAEPEWGGRLEPMLSRSDTIIAGCEEIEDYASEFCDDIHVIPTAVPREKYIDAIGNGTSAYSGRSVSIGWIGYPENLQYLKPLRPVLEGLLDRGIRFKAITDLKRLDDPVFEHENFQYVQWKPGTAILELAQCDISIRPMPDDPWSRGKCYTSVIEAMALGLPVVVSPISNLKDWIHHGLNGFHATDEDEWEFALRELTNNPTLRKRIGKAGKRRIEELGLWKSQTFPHILNVIENT